MKTRRARCSCGKLSITTHGEPVRVSVCHCWDCQRRTGSPFAAQARFATSEVQIEGDSRSYQRTGDAGSRASFHFCPECGATVYYTLDAMPDLVAIPIGAFASHDLPPPSYSVYETRRHPWVQLTGDMEHHD